MKSALAKVLIAGLVGGGAWYLGGYATNKITTIQKNPWIIPALFIGIGILLARRGRLASGFGLAGAGGAIGVLQLQLRAASEATKGDEKAMGIGDAGRGDSGLYDRPAPAGALFGTGAKNLFEQQNTMGNANDNGWGEAGALFGSGGEQLRRQADSMGWAA
jgi:hypothetical protein